jgi:hypothetical protein
VIVNSYSMCCQKPWPRDLRVQACLDVKLRAFIWNTKINSKDDLILHLSQKPKLMEYKRGKLES